MEHKLGVNHEVVVQPKASGVVLPVLGKLLTKANQHSIQPPQHVGTVVNLGFEDGDPRHQHCGGFLIEIVGNGRVARFRKVSGDRRNAETELSRRVLVVRDELDHSARVGLEGLACRSDDFEVDGVGRLGREGTDLPRGGLANSDFGFSDPR